MIDLVLGGVWSVACVFMGAWLQYRREIYHSPFPGIRVYHREDKNADRV